VIRRLLLAFALLLAAAPAWADNLPAVGPQDRVLGRADAPVTVVEYASFTCPHCARWHIDVLPQLKSRYIDSGKVRLVFRDLPTPPQDVAATAAALARCAEPSRYYDVTSALMHGQEALRTSGDAAVWFQSGVAASGRSMEQIQACVSDPATLAALRAGIEGGRGAGVAGTPTFFVNGARVANGEIETLSAAIDPLLPR
jgi:protein-disulfide isomerase